MVTVQMVRVQKERTVSKIAAISPSFWGGRKEGREFSFLTAWWMKLFVSRVERARHK